MSGIQCPRRVLFVFWWLVVGGEETEVRLVARHLDRTRYTLDVVGCHREPKMLEQTHRQLEALGVPLDVTPYGLSPEEKIAYLAKKVTGYDLVVSFQAVPEIFPALERAPWRSPLIEHGGIVPGGDRDPEASYGALRRCLRGDS